MSRIVRPVQRSRDLSDGQVLKQGISRCAAITLTRQTLHDTPIPEPPIRGSDEAILRRRLEPLVAVLVPAAVTRSSSRTAILIPDGHGW